MGKSKQNSLNRINRQISSAILAGSFDRVLRESPIACFSNALRSGSQLSLFLSAVSRSGVGRIIPIIKSIADSAPNIARNWG